MRPSQRAACEEIVAELVRIEQQCKAVPDYCKAAKKWTGIRTPTDLSILSAGGSSGSPPLRRRSVKYSHDGPPRTASPEPLQQTSAHFSPKKRKKRLRSTDNPVGSPVAMIPEAGTASEQCDNLNPGAADPKPSESPQQPNPTTDSQADEEGNTPQGEVHQQLQDAESQAEPSLPATAPTPVSSQTPLTPRPMPASQQRQDAGDGSSPQRLPKGPAPPPDIGEHGQAPRGRWAGWRERVLASSQKWLCCGE